MRRVLQLALKALDINLPLFRQDTILDLAVAHECMDFLSKHCSAAITIQLFGDMQVRHGARGKQGLKDQRRQEHTCSRPFVCVCVPPSRSLCDAQTQANRMKTINGMLRILLGITTLGLVPAFLPRFIQWEPPPKSEQMRGSRQRRLRPEGDRSEETEEVNLSPSRWYKRLYLFLTCPVVIFHTDKIICVCINLMFTFWFLAHRQAVNADAVAAGVGGLGEHSIILIPFKVSSNLDIEPLQGVEIALCIYYGCSLVRELTEILCELDDWENLLDVLKKYISSFWNVLDMGEIVAFVAGILYRVDVVAFVAGRDHPQTPAPSRRHDHPQTTPPNYEYKDKEWTNWSLAYGACLFIAWFRVLRSCYAFPTTSKMCGFCVSRFLYP